MRHDNDAVALAMDFPEVQQYLQAVRWWRPLKIAIDNRMVDRVHALIQAGADPRPTPNEPGPSCLELAMKAASYTGAKLPVREIEMLLQHATMGWAPCRHPLYSQPHRHAIFALLKLPYLFAKAQYQPTLPPEIWLHIAGFVCRSWFVADPVKLETGWIEPTSQSRRYDLICSIFPLPPSSRPPSTDTPQIRPLPCPHPDLPPVVPNPLLWFSPAPRPALSYVQTKGPLAMP